MINRPPKYELESIESYLNRLGKANYYQESNWPHQLYELPREAHLNFLWDNKKLEQIAAGIDLPFNEVQAMTIHRFAPFVIGQKIWNEFGRNLFLAASKPSRICPHCMAENGAMLLPWLLRPITTCPTHQVILVDTCPACRLPLFLNMDRCYQCGLSIKKFETISIAEDMISSKMYIFIWQITGCQDIYDISEIGFPFSEISPIHFFAMLWKMGTLLLEYDPHNPNFFSETIIASKRKNSRDRLREMNIYGYHKVVRAVGEILLEWPGAWHQALARIANSEQERRIAYQKDQRFWKRQSFPYALRRVMQDEPIGSWLWKELVDFTTQNNIIPGVCFWGRSVRKGWNRPAKPPPPYPTGENTNHQNDFQEKSEGHDDLLSFEQAISYLGTTRGELRALISAGIIRPEPLLQPNARKKWRFSKQNLESVLQTWIGDLPKITEHVASTQDLIELKKALRYLNHAGIRWIDLLQAILRRDISACVAPEKPGLKSVWVSAQDLIVFRDRWTKSNGFASIYTVMKLLGCGQETLSHLAAMGLLVPAIGYPEKPNKEWQYSYPSIQNFQDRFITTELAAKVIGCSTRTLVAWVKNNWITAVSGPQINGARGRWFDRNKVNQWRHERLLSTEVRELLGISQRTLEAWVASGKLKPLKDMSQHPYWFLREDIERLIADRAG